MSYASNSDIEAWFSVNGDKIDINDANSSKAKIEADRLIRGMLAGVFTALTMSGWTTPETTPEQIRGISGRLCAAYIYRGIYSEEQEAVPEYAQTLYNEAIAMLNDIKTGNLVVVDPGVNPVEGNTGILSFWPDDTTTPKFTMDQEFA